MIQVLGSNAAEIQVDFAVITDWHECVIVFAI